MQNEHEEDLSRMDRQCDSTDARTAPANQPTPTPLEKDLPNVIETEVGMGRFVNDNIFAETTRLDTCVVVVSGPDFDDEICLMHGAESYLPRATAHALALDILGRLRGDACGRGDHLLCTWNHCTCSCHKDAKVEGR